MENEKRKSLSAWYENENWSRDIKKNLGHKKWNLSYKKKTEFVIVCKWKTELKSK